jgi:hypothetical protein
MRGARAGLVVMAFAAAISATAFAQAKKDASPGAVTSGSAAMALPSSGSRIQGAEVPQSGTMAVQPPTTNDAAGVVETNGRTTEKARSN